MRAGAAAACVAAAVGGPAHAQEAATLRARHAALREALSHSAFGRPLVLESAESAGLLRGDVYAVVAQPIGVVGPALQGAASWCDVLVIHPNVKSCRARGNATAGTLTVAVGRTLASAAGDVYPIDFVYRLAASQPDYVQLGLTAAAGPLGTKDYRIGFEATALDANSTFVHLSYAYGYGTTARIAMATYLATLGRDKVGFSLTGRSRDGTPLYVNGLRGAVERNAMRYHLAVEAYLGALGLPAAQQPDQRLQDWFDATERYPRQLREMTRDGYLQIKRRELAQRTGAAPR